MMDLNHIFCHYLSSPAVLGSMGFGGGDNDDHDNDNDNDDNDGTLYGTRRNKSSHHLVNHTPLGPALNSPHTQKIAKSTWGSSLT